MTAMIPDPDGDDRWLIGSAAEPAWGIQTGVAVLRNVHLPEQCVGKHCCVHNPSPHHMRDWPLNWRGDRRGMERVCPHGVGHPDPDDLAWHVREGRDWMGVHGCCKGECCARVRS